MNFKLFWSTDFRSSIVVFLVALPLCLGIALASGAPLFSGILTGILGGIVVGALSASPLSVSGPAAGLTSIVAAAILELGSFQAFLLALVLAGILQWALGYFRAGTIGHFFPISVIKGMLVGIGVILILKQLPHLVGVDADFEGDQAFFQPGGGNTLSSLRTALDAMSPGAVVISATGILLLVLWDLKRLKRYWLFRTVPAGLIVVLAGIALQAGLLMWMPAWALAPNHLVDLPDRSPTEGWTSLLVFPDFGAWTNPKIYTIAVTIALVASIETLLNIEACDKLDPYRRITPLNRELRAQGTANFISGLLGGLPLTSVVVRSSTNITSGARTRASAISHGIILLFMVMAFPVILEYIPLAALAAILLVIGFKLVSPSLCREMYRKGASQFLPFVITVLGVAGTDLLTGVALGIAASTFFILRTNFQEAIFMVSDGDRYLLKTTKDVSFLNKAHLRRHLESIPANASVILDGTASSFVDADIKETIEDFVKEAGAKNITVDLKKFNF